MNTERIFYHFGWVLGVFWLVMGLGQTYIGLRARATSNFDGWDVYPWLGVGLFAIGVAWLIWWYASYRQHPTDGTGR